jgi:effector-binding domain-containing protein
MAVDFEVVAVEPRRILAVRNSDPGRDYAKIIMACLDRVWQLLKASPARRGHNVVIYRDGAITEAGVELLEEIEAPEGLFIVQTPAGRVATAAHLGNYDGIHATAMKLVADCQAQGRVLEGTSWEVYGDWKEDPAKLRTDIYFLLK